MTAPWRQSTGWPSTVASTSTSGPAALDERRPDEHGAERLRRRAPSARGRPRRSRPGGRRRCGARRCRRRRSSAGRPARRGSRHRAGSCPRRCRGPAARRPAARPAGRTGRPTRAASTSWWTRRRAAPGRRPRRGRRACGPRAAQRRARAGSAAWAAKAPCRASTPTFTWGPRCEHRALRLRGRRRRLPAAVGELRLERADLEAGHGRPEAAGHLGDDAGVV